MKEGVRKAIRERQIVLTDLIHAIREYRKLADQKPLTLTIITGEPNEFVREIHTGCQLFCRKSITILGYPVKPEKRLWSLTRQSE